MRKRSVSFYAKNEEEFERNYDRKKSLMERRNSRISPFTKKNNSSSLNQKEKKPYYSSYDDLEIDELGVNSSFQITQKEEDAEEAEINLMNKFSNLNLSIKKKDKNMFYENLCSKNILKGEEDEISFQKKSWESEGKKDNNDYLNKLKMRTLIGNNSFDSIKLYKQIKNRSNTFDEIFNLENGNNLDEESILSFINSSDFLSQNIDITQDILKFLVMGSENSGKSYFISKLFNEEIKKENEKFCIMDIRKKNIKLLGNYIRLELLDTNSILANTEMINVYFKISDGMIMIIDSQNPLSATYIYDLIQKMKYKIFDNKYNLLILCISKNIENINENARKNFDETNMIVSQIETEFEYKVINVELDNRDFFLNIINRFLSLTYLKKERKNKKNKKWEEIRKIRSNRGST